jgi:hypothetical protein
LPCPSTTTIPSPATFIALNVVPGEEELAAELLGDPEVVEEEEAALFEEPPQAAIPTAAAVTAVAGPSHLGRGRRLVRACRFIVILFRSADRNHSYYVSESQTDCRGRRKRRLGAR